MIQNAIFSYWNKLGDESTSGFNYTKDLCISTALAVECAKKHFKNITLYTNEYGKKLLVDKAGIDFTHVTTELSQFDNTLDKFFWGYTKIYTYSKQTEPFVHIDNDFYIWKFENDLRYSDLIFQSEEVFGDIVYKYYRPLIDLYNNSPFKIPAITNNPVERGLNCGIIGANNLNVIKEWFKASTEFINNPENIKYFYANYPRQMEHINLLHEQYFISSLARKNNIEHNTKFMMNSLKDVSSLETPFTHLWGTTKREGNIIERVKDKLRTMNPSVVQSIDDNIK